MILNPFKERFQPEGVYVRDLDGFTWNNVSWSWNLHIFVEYLINYILGEFAKTSFKLKVWSQERRQSVSE